MKIEFTICLITANRPLLLKKALDSIQKLSLKNFALIICDNSSDKRSEMLIKKFPLPVKYVHNNPPLNEIQNSNKCIGLATTDIVCLFHDDDMFAPDYFNQIIKNMLKDKRISLGYSGRKMIDEHNRVITEQIIKDGYDIYLFDSKKILNEMLLGIKCENYVVPINTPGLVFRKKIFDEMGGFDETIETHCDTDFLFRILSVADKTIFINKSLYLNKIWYGSSGRTKSSENGNVFFSEKSVIDNFISFAKKKKLTYYLQKKKAIYKKYANDCLSPNGAFGWIALRYKGRYTERCAALFATLKGVIALNKDVFFLPQFYFVVIASFILPQFILQLLQKILIRIYLQKG